MKLLYLPLLLLSATVLSAQTGQPVSGHSLPNEQWVNDNIRFAEQQLRLLLQTPLSGNTPYPRTIDRNGQLITTGMHEWTSGFFPGSLWRLYELTGDETVKVAAKQWTGSLEPLKTYERTHDLGFMMYCSFGNGLRLAPAETVDYKKILIEGAISLASRFNEAVGCIQSWDKGTSWHGASWTFPVIIDNMMNLELLLYAAGATDDTTLANRLRRIAVTHANTTIVNHLRTDYTSYHVVDYHPTTGAVNEKVTAQGWSDNSTWARGQAWGIYGFTMMYRETGDTVYLHVARKMADVFLRRLPEDGVPYWDLNAGQPGYTPPWPDRTDRLPYPPDRFPVSQYRDASAGAIAASALLELYAHTRYASYLLSAATILRSLSSDAYRSQPGENAGFLLKHCTGSIPHGSEIDVPLVYADYYFLEALLRYRALSSSNGELRRAKGE